MDILREGLADALFNERLVAFDQRGQGIGVEIRVLLGARLALGGGKQFLERIGELVRLGAHLEHDIAVHVDEAPVAVVGEPPVARQRCQPFDGLVVQTEIQDGVHHPRHRFAGTGANRHQQRIVSVAEALALLGFDSR